MEGFFCYSFNHYETDQLTCIQIIYMYILCFLGISFGQLLLFFKLKVVCTVGVSPSLESIVKATVSGVFEDLKFKISEGNCSLLNTLIP